MTMIADARGNEYQGQLDAITNAVIVDPRVATATLGVANAEALVDLNGHATLMVDLRATAASMTVVFEATIDGTNYIALAGYNTQSALYVPSVVSTTTLNTQIAINVAGYRRARVRCSAYTSGAITVALRATIGMRSMIVVKSPATAGLTATAAAGAACTLTIPAPGVGMYQYIDWIRISHFAAALLTAGASPTIVTSTNLPGTPSWNFRADAAPQGTETPLVVQNGMPIRASAANTAVTIVAPVTTGVLWKISASWRVGA